MRGTPRIAGAAVRWQEYRHTITDYVQHTAEVTGRILILGAGGCDDVDILAFLRTGADVYLADINREAMLEAVATVRHIDEVLTTRLHVIETDFVCITTQDYEVYETACRSGVRELDEWWMQYHHKIRSIREASEAGDGWMLRDIIQYMRCHGIDSFDTVLYIGVQSQLYIELLRRLQLQQEVSREVKTEAVRRIQEANVWIAEALMKGIRHCGRRVILGIEYTSMEPDGALQKEILYQLTTRGSRGLQEMQLSRVEGAVQLDQQILIQQAEHAMIRDYQYVLWPFSCEKTYLMIIYWLDWQNVV